MNLYSRTIPGFGRSVQGIAHVSHVSIVIEMQVQRELEEERKVAKEEAAKAQQAIEAKQAELAAIEATRKREVHLVQLPL